MDKIIKSLKTSQDLLNKFIRDNENIIKISKIAAAIVNSFHSGHKIIICGNGGSATDAMHFAEEFTGKFRSERPALPAIALSDPSHITCVGNDYGFDHIFSRGVEAFGQKGDLLIVLSTSGNSRNIIKAIASGKELELTTCSLLGNDGGNLKGFCDHEIIIPGITSDRIQEMHMLILHIIIEQVERDLFPENYL